MKTRQLILLSFVLILLSDVILYLNGSFIISIDATTITAIAKFVALWALIQITKKANLKKAIPAKVYVLFKLIIIWNIVAIIRGLLTSNDYWDFKFLILTSSFSFFIPYAISVGVLFGESSKMLALVIKKILAFGFLIIPLTIPIDPARELYPRALVIYACLFLIFSPYFPKKWRLLMLFVAFISVFIAIDFRSNIVRTGLATALFLMYFVRSYVKKSYLNIAFGAAFLVPVFLLFAGITGQYNVFKQTDDPDKYKTVDQFGNESNIAADTRTGLYEEVLASMYMKNSFLIGEGGAGKYKSESFDYLGDNRGRYGAEVGFLNTLLYSGIIGVFLNAVMLFSAVYLAVNRSNNFLCKMLGMFLAFRWIMYFVEDYTSFDTNFYFLWFTIGLCFSRQFRALNDAQIRGYFKYIIERESVNFK